MTNRLWLWLPVLALLTWPGIGCGSASGGDDDAVDDGGPGEGEPPAAGLWVGTGHGDTDGDFTICFNVDADGASLVEPSEYSVECGMQSFWIEFDNESCQGALLLGETIDIVDGSFDIVRLEGGMAGYWDIHGTFDGSTASGEATIGGFPDGYCSGSWTASPVP